MLTPIIGPASSTPGCRPAPSTIRCERARSLIPQPTHQETFRTLHTSRVDADGPPLASGCARRSVRKAARKVSVASGPSRQAPA